MALLATGAAVLVRAGGLGQKLGSTQLAVAAGPPARWDSVGGNPVIVSIGGQEAVLGRLRNVGKGDELFIGAFDSTSLTPRWTAGPFGTYGDGYQSTQFVVSGVHVVVTDFHAVVHVLDLETGKQLRAVTLTDKVEIASTLDYPSICSTGPDGVWLEQIDKRAVAIDLATGAVREAPRPPGCKPARERDSFGSTIPRFEPSGAPFVTKSAFVILGTKSPGTPTPMVVGLDAKSHALRWQVPLPAADPATVRDSTEHRSAAMCGEERFVAAYGVGEKSWHVASLDATSGARQWDVVLRPIFAVDSLGGIVCSRARVYVVRMGSVDVLDAATGKALGTIGAETYDDAASRAGL